MLDRRMPRLGVVCAGVAALALGVSGVGIAAAAPSSTYRPTAKPAPLIPDAAKSAQAPRGSSALAAGTVARAPSSQSTTQASQDGACEVGDVCLYYLSNFVGSIYDTAHNDPNLFDNHFITAGLGQGAVVGSNAESVWNRDPGTSVYLCTGLNYTGCGFVLPNQFGNLNSTYKNQTQSLIWADSIN